MSAIKDDAGLRGTWVGNWFDVQHVCWLDRVTRDTPENFPFHTASLAWHKFPEGIAVVSPIAQVVTRSTSASRLLGIPSYGDVTAKLEELAHDPDVRGIMLRLGTLAGMLEGLIEAAVKIGQIAAVKPVIALLEHADAVSLPLAAGASRIVVWEAPEGLATYRVDDGMQPVAGDVGEIKPLLRMIARARRLPIDAVGVLRRRVSTAQLIKLGIVDLDGGIDDTTAEWRRLIEVKE